MTLAPRRGPRTGRFGSGVALPSAEPEEAGGAPIIETFLANDAVPNTAEAEDPEDSGQKAFNYRTEPMWFRMGFAPDAPLTFTRDLIFTDVLTNAQVGGDPETPVFDARPSLNGMLGLYWGCQDIEPSLPGTCDGFQDARGRNFYRPMAACKMRQVTSPFCRVCSFLIVERIKAKALTT